MFDFDIPRFSVGVGWLVFLVMGGFVVGQQGVVEGRSVPCLGGLGVGRGE